MSVKTIGAAFLSAAEAEWLAPAACTLARSFDAHLVGVHAADPVVPYAGAMAFDPVIVPEFLDWQVDEAEAIRTSFETVASREGVASEFRGQDANTIGSEAFMIEALRAVDFIISAHADRHGWNQTGVRLQEQIIRNSGRPVLVLPKSRPLAGPASRLLVGVSPTREATRAVHDALLLAVPGAEIELLSVTHDAQPASLAFDLRQDLAAALDRLGFRASVLDRDGSAGQAGEVLLKTAAERGADLVVTGAFGHSRTYDFVIGAATSHLLDKAELPVLYAK
jgi:nucleotide-binding universal stress UspA family protein